MILRRREVVAPPRFEVVKQGFFCDTALHWGEVLLLKPTGCLFELAMVFPGSTIRICVIVSPAVIFMVSAQVRLP